jgi:hypothetical protein
MTQVHPVVTGNSANNLYLEEEQNIECRFQGWVFGNNRYLTLLPGEYKLYAKSDGMSFYMHDAERILIKCWGTTEKHVGGFTKPDSDDGTWYAWQKPTTPHKQSSTKFAVEVDSIEILETEYESPEYLIVYEVELTNIVKSITNVPNQGGGAYAKDAG